MARGARAGLWPRRRPADTRAQGIRKAAFIKAAEATATPLDKVTVLEIVRLQFANINTASKDDYQRFPVRNQADVR